MLKHTNQVKQELSAIESLLRLATDSKKVSYIASHVGLHETHQSCPRTRKRIKQLIESGCPIGSDRHGYFMMKSYKDVQDYLNSLLKRQVALSVRIKNVHEAFQKVGGDTNGSYE